MSYQDLFPIYQRAKTWQEFLSLISSGPSKWVLLRAIELGWSTRIHLDLCKQFQVPDEEVVVLLDRYQVMVNTTPKHASASELTQQLGQVINTANQLRGYFRYAYYVAVDEPDTIFTILDEHFTKLGAGTPTRDECARGYTAVTGRHVNPDAVVLSADRADEIADHLAAESEDIHKRLTRTVVTAPGQAAQLALELEKLDRLHVELTGKSVIDITAVKKLREYLVTCTKNISDKKD